MNKITGAIVVLIIAIIAVSAGLFTIMKNNNNPTIYENTTGAGVTVVQDFSYRDDAYGEAITEESSITEMAVDLTTQAITSVKESTSKLSLFDKLKGNDSESTTDGRIIKESTTNRRGTKDDQTGVYEKTSVSSDSKTTMAAGSYEYSYAGFNPQYIEITDENWEMVLINRHYIIDKNYVPKLEYAIKGDTGSKKLDCRVAEHYNDMYQAAAKDGIYLTTVSGYRSYDHQKTNFENKISKYINQQGMSRVKATQEAAKIILPPGTSEHNAGLAMDIISLEQNFENTKAFRWLMENAADYGFILRYPKDKQDITEIIYEPWHWRYVGVDNAKKIKASGLCLEEYLNKMP